jgi:hypothetical protein
MTQSGHGTQQRAKKVDHLIKRGQSVALVALGAPHSLEAAADHHCLTHRLALKEYVGRFNGLPHFYSSPKRNWLYGLLMPLGR